MTHLWKRLDFSMLIVANQHEKRKKNAHLLYMNFALHVESAVVSMPARSLAGAVTLGFR